MITIPPRFVIFGQKWAKIEKIDLKIFCWPERKWGLLFDHTFIRVMWPEFEFRLQPNQIKQYLKLSKFVRQVWIKYPQTVRLKFSDGSSLVGSKKSFFFTGLARVRTGPRFNVNAGPSTGFADPTRFDPWISGLDTTLSGGPSIQKKS